MQRPKRKEIPQRIKLRVALRQLASFFGCETEDLRLDHHPALGLRLVNEQGDDYLPPQHDENNLQWLPQDQHTLKTTGRRGESELSLSGNGDVARIAKAKRIALSEEERRFRAKLLRVTTEEGKAALERRRYQWPKRAFPKKPKPM